MGTNVSLSQSRGSFPLSHADGADIQHGSVNDNRQNMRQWFVVILPFVFLWGSLISQLSAEWRVNPQYSHGWVVPLLCLSSIISRWQRGSAGSVASNPGFALPPSNALITFLFGLLAVLWLPTRLVQEANPEWRMISWLLAFEVIGLTLATIWLRSGPARAAQFAFPILFFLVAVPWPTIVEAPLIQLLTRICAALTVEVAGCLGIPAVQHANIIEVATGSVGIDEACSGIRSFQSTLMIALFLGDLYFLTLWRRIALAPLGFLLALFFNVCRTSFLTWVAAKKGVAALSKYHDPAGVAIMIACLISLWLLALLMSGRSSNPPPPVRPIRFSGAPSQPLRRLAFGLLLWVVASGAAVELWYRMHEWRLPRSVSWSLNWPRANPSFSETPVGEKAMTLLRYDQAVSASWREPDGTGWYMIYLRWLPGRVAAHLANLHTPNVCLTAAGHAVESLPDLVYLPVHGLKLPFREYILNDGGEPAYVFYCLWEDRAQSQFFKTEMLTYDSRLSGVLAGQRNCGQRSLEVLIHGVRDIKEAEGALVRELNNLVQVGTTAEAKL